ncbi:cell division cycle-associated 7-like protein [Onthophagus taurus]|uniref:cell division cycle-associated 7-like protein n=1 Tax=Onthophagus taurus TaxID=166361 RepID=UPI000C2023CB|nr:cell division cycle-associated 7-like protein [Onthophagus taurus]
MDLESEVSDYESLREQNMKELQALMSQFETPDFDDTMDAINTYEEIKKGAKRKRDGGDSTFRCSVMVPLETRRSSRLAKITPKYSYLDLPDEKLIKDSNYDDVDIEDLEKPLYHPRKRSNYKTSNSTPFKIVPVELITENYLKNIASRTTKKIYSQNGTSCHQCRQKTMDSKTYCRNSECVGVRGQFCGVCLKNRYGEDAKNALLDPNWKCPPCRGLCNCSICRAREGKRPTGILAPLAFKHGHKSVKDFLFSLNGRGDFVENCDEMENCKDEIYENNCLSGCDHFDLIGFDKDGFAVVLVNDKDRICDRKGDLLGFNSEIKPVLVLNSK